MSEDNESTIYHPFDPDWTVPPGETLKEWAEEHDPEHEELLFWYTPQELDDLFAGRRELTPDDALILASMTGIPIRLWSRMEGIYRADLAAGRVWRG